MGDEADAEFVQGGEEPLHYEQDPEVSTPVLSSLTRPMHIAAWEDAQLNRTVELLTAELAQPQIGATAAVNPGRRMAGPYGRPAPAGHWKPRSHASGTGALLAVDSLRGTGASGARPPGTR